MGRFLRGLIWLITFGRINLDPNAPPDYTKSKTKIDNALKGYLAALKLVREEKKRLESATKTLEANIKASVDGERADNREALFDIKLNRKEIGLLKAREGTLCSKIERAKTLLGMIALYEDSRPMEVDEEVRKISDRIQLRIDEINVDLQEAQRGELEIDETITISDHDEVLDRIEEEILARKHRKSSAAKSGEAAVVVAPVAGGPIVVTSAAVALVAPVVEARPLPPLPQAQAAREAVKNADTPPAVPTYEVVEEADEDEVDGYREREPA